MDDTVAAGMTAEAGRWLKPSMLTGVAASQRPACLHAVFSNFSNAPLGGTQNRKVSIDHGLRRKIKSFDHERLELDHWVLSDRRNPSWRRGDHTSSRS